YKIAKGDIMPTINSSQIHPDSVIMTPNDVNDSIVNYLEIKGFSVVRGTTHSEEDIRAVKNDLELIIESRGNQAYKNFGTDIVFDGSQLDIQLSEQLTQTMRFQQFCSTRNTAVFIMGFPDINRVKERVS
ncbi:hypothetical protein V7659_06715, partial [Neobacillus drentensis]|uniref:hypothetical protein n=1 Tax=Neobacillus drentensis TaxID=220684 RepID=UPI003000E804